MLISIEGIDGSGKATQAALLAARASLEGHAVASFSFPRYGTNPFAVAITRYLSGDFGDVNEVPPELAALLYAGDRLAARDELSAALASQSVVICDRFVHSNLAYQAAKLGAESRQHFLSWLEAIEFEVHKMPKPDLVLLLQLSPELARQMTRQRVRDAGSAPATDIHETNEEYLGVCDQVFTSLAKENPSVWRVVRCDSPAGTLRGSGEISEEVWSAVSGSNAWRNWLRPGLR